MDKKEMLHLFGQVHSDSWNPSQRKLKVRGSFSHRLAVNSPPRPPLTSAVKRVQCRFGVDVDVVLPVAAAAPLLCCGRGRCVLEPQKQQRL